MDRIWGHTKGVSTLRDIVRCCPDFGVDYLTVYAFSSENWQRPAQEVSGLLDLFQDYLQKETEELHRQGVCLRIIGDKKRLTAKLQALIQQAEDLTKHNTSLKLQIALSYGSRDEIVGAAKKLALDLANQRLTLNDITCESFSQALETAPWPDPDVLIRTGGERRLSNYLLWQLSYTELFFVDTYWPDFLPKDLEEILASYAQRVRRFGRIELCE